MAAHSDKGPSSSDRWLHCTPSVKLCADMPDTGSSFAEEGTQAHIFCEYLLHEAMGKKAENPKDSLSFYTNEMRECAEGYRDYVMELYETAKKTCVDPVLMVEQRISYERFAHGGFGTADCILIADGTLNVVDFKFGAGVAVSAEGNSQMRIYALGALEIFDSLYDIHTVQLTIYQPRKSNISTDQISRDELYEWAENVLKPAAIEADEGTGEFHAGEWCRWCRAKHICRERAKKNLELAAFEFADPPLLEDVEVVEVLNKVDNLIAWANDVKEYALREAIGGKSWPGYKLVEGRSVRRYTDEKAVEKAVSDAGFYPFETRLLTITEMQAMMGKKRMEEVLGGLIVKPQGKPTLVPESDKRSPMNVM